jgi:hypothetical protein
MSMTFYCMARHLSECNGSQVASMKQDMNFNFQMSSTFLFLVIHKNDLCTVVHRFKTYYFVTFRGPTIPGASLSSA